MRRFIQLALLFLLALGLANPAHATITRTASGGASSKTSSTTLTQFITAAAGSSLVVTSAVQDGTIGVSAVAWNGATFTSQNGFSGSGITCDIWVANNVPAGTNVLMTVTYTAAVVAKAFAVSEISGWPSGSAVVDRNLLPTPGGAGGTSVNADSGLTATTTDANEYLAGNVSVNGPTGDGAPTWLNSFSAGQRLGTTGGGAASNCTVNEGFRIVSATAQYKAAATLATSRNWAASIVTLKDSGGAPAAPKRLPLLGVG